MKIVFFGTPDYVLPVLTKLYKVYGKGPEGVAAVVTQSPKEAGRKKYIERSAVDNWAYKHTIPVIYDLEKIPESSLGVVAAYGKIIPEEVIKRFGSGMLNIHPSLLPLLRGAAPIQGAVALGMPSGLSIIKMDELMDHGPIVSQYKEEIEETDTNETLRTRLFEKAANVIIELIPNYLVGKINLKPQDHSKATFTRIIRRDDGFIPAKFIKATIEGETLAEEFDLGFVKETTVPVTPQNINNFIRSLTPWPGTWTFISLDGKEKRLKILNSHLDEGKLILDEVCVEGKNPVTWKQFGEGYPHFSFGL